MKNNIENFSNSIKINKTTKIMFEGEMKEFKDKITNYESKLKENKKEINKLQNILTTDEQTMKNCNFKINKTEANFNVLTSSRKKT